MRKLSGRPGLVCLLFALFAIFATSSLIGQSVRGALAGTVTDSSGAVVAGANIVATGVETGATSATISTGSGDYRFPELPIGRYNVAVTAPGFSKSTSTGVLVTVDSISTLNIVLKAGSVSETVTVDASSPTIETESSDVGGTVTTKQIEDLPLSLALGVNGMRSPETFEFLVPGTTGPGSATQGNSSNGVFFARLSGGQAYGNETLLDGASVQRSENGSSFDETSPSIEALSEFKVTTSTPSAEFGRTTSGITSFSVKSGTNDFHGIGYGIVKNRAFDANNWFNDGYKDLNCVGVSEINCAYSKPADSKYDYGGIFSGPVKIPHVYD
jgi:Carboxypeptidase regulatory-like domain